MRGFSITNILNVLFCDTYLKTYLQLSRKVNNLHHVNIYQISVI